MNSKVKSFRKVFCLLIFTSGFIVTELTFAAIPLENSNPACQHDRTTFRCVKYLKNYDADTITFQIHDVHPLLGDKISIRVLGVDTPEIKGHQPCEKDAARASKRLVENLLKNAKRIDLKDVARDKYFRVLADVQVDGKSLTDLLLKNGLGYRYYGKTKEKVNWCSFGSGNQLTN